MNSIIDLFPAFLLVFIRISAFFVTVPVFGHRNLPAVHRIGFAFFLSVICFSTLKHAPAIDIGEQYMLLVIKEAVVGLSLGLIAFMMMAAIQIAGSFIDFQMGFSIANVIDPQSGTQSPLIGQFVYTLALLFMLSVNAHYLLLDGIYYSFQYIPLDQAFPSFGNDRFGLFIAKSFNAMFIIAFQMSAPVVASLFLVDLALGIVARTVPQLNVFVVGLPLKIAVSFIMLIVCMAVMFVIVRNIFSLTVETMRNLLALVGVT
ncbi:MULTISPECIES: flagellar biosynthetic protein FliR [Bacillus]|jgi:flagellar biosynthetic protein FliR|uniref:Flagellar biosynthetic protein FliR n=1 Tax=Bacillus amyloliquefaciens (strain ATCC 23350 / DSM 7 / BCRC 11601 / CCUG 28519 / NBRC 15535 / NRRL B-14393 / F) TaxID=692420 RepID=A0A9P1NHW9_BACAS|nr:MULTISPECIES: flagellar biosynthetic protein FliR [Bacillus amyloliquefaciens group]AIW33641.1 flagellar biosynthesis protein FliR [Bacillus subtilis]AEB23960.1 flagellar biosynthesis protein FliR [Bacillus amyloliquefaciens TA208]AEB63337.1 component of the flagellar export machinery [Bacillus amyloliquefaciens LL3]AEK88956.1 flagellar biosynthesis protein FliR [Bacillus amyloliquefaciens XH7]ARW38913.1 Flagellar biosynthetic protein FliR [Bacillus amyloliquefaciens]